jgi:hypothetical protein
MIIPVLPLDDSSSTFLASSFFGSSFFGSSFLGSSFFVSTFPTALETAAGFALIVYFSSFFVNLAPRCPEKALRTSAYTLSSSYAEFIFLTLPCFSKI